MVRTTTASRNADVSANEPVAQGDVAPKHDIPSRTVAAINAKDTNLFALAQPSNRMVEKSKLLSTVRPLLEQFTELLDTETEQRDELEGKIEVALFQGLTQGLVNYEEVTQELGGTFGWRKKGDAKTVASNSSEASKTPYGYGETLRKRIQRAQKAYQFAHTNWEGDNFFNPMDRTEVADIISKLENGETGVFQVYNELQDYAKELKADAPDRVDPAFDPKRVMKLVGALTEDGAADTFAENPSLIVAYGGLIEAIQNLNARLMEREDAADIVEAVRHAPALEI